MRELRQHLRLQLRPAGMALTLTSAISLHVQRRRRTAEMSLEEGPAIR
jgi:hypothetical protein